MGKASKFVFGSKTNQTLDDKLISLVFSVLVKKVISSYVCSSSY